MWLQFRLLDCMALRHRADGNRKQKRHVLGVRPATTTSEVVVAKKATRATSTSGLLFGSPKTSALVHTSREFPTIIDRGESSAVEEFLIRFIRFR